MNPPTEKTAVKGAKRRGAPPGTRRLRLTLSYDGAPWRGWQKMPSGSTIQDQLNAAFLAVCGQPVPTQGSGRTDAGVHALGQVAHADVPLAANLSMDAWVRALNNRLPPSIRVLDVDQTDPAFHARFDATGKTYRYRISRSQVLSPFEAGRVWQVHGPLDVAALRAGCGLLEGTHDFARLSVNRSRPALGRPAAQPGSSIRTLHRVVLTEQDDALEIEFVGSGFLYKMVRLMVGSLVYMARGRAELSWFQDLIENPSTHPKSHHVAPPDGLCLMSVHYGTAAQRLS